MSPARRIACAVVGVGLLCAAAWLFQHFAEAGGRYIVVFAAGTLAFGGLALLGSAVTGR